MAGFLTYSTFATVASSASSLNWAQRSTMSTTSLSILNTSSTPITTYSWSTLTLDGASGPRSGATQSFIGSTSGVTGTSSWGLTITQFFNTAFTSGVFAGTLTATDSQGQAISLLTRSTNSNDNIGTSFQFSYTEPGLTITSSSTGNSGTTLSITSRSAFRQTATTSSSSSISTLSNTTNFTSTSSGTTVTGTAFHSAATITISVTTSMATNSNVTSTQASTVTSTRWTLSGQRTTATFTTVGAVLASLTVTANTTVTTTQSRVFTTVQLFLPGTCFLATGQGFQVDLPAWLIGSNWPGSMAGSWNYSFNTAGTTLPVLPSATTHAVSTTATSAIAHPGSFTLLDATTLTIFGSSSFTSVSTATALPPFTSTSLLKPGETASIPLSTVSQTVTTWSTFTQTYSTTFTTPINTIISGTTTTVTTSQNVGGSPSSQNGTRSTVFSIQTVVNGYTTMAATQGIGGGVGQVSTTIVSGPGLSATTTTLAGLWWYDWSCPTALLSAGSTTSSTSGSTSTQAIGTSVSSLTGGTSVSSGTPTVPYDFVRNIFGQPYMLVWPVQTASISSNPPNGAIGTVKVWSAVPMFQGFVPWSATSNTYSTIQAPAGVEQLTFGAVETGLVGSYFSDSTSSGRPITSTAWGLWGLLAQPHTTTVTVSSTVTTSAAPGTTTQTYTYTQVDSWTASNETAGTALTAQASIAWPPGMNESSATISVSSTFTTSTTASPGTTTESSSNTFGGFTFSTAAVSQTFAESQSYVTQTAPNIPGVGGTMKLGSGAATIWAINAAVSLFFNTSSTFSAADYNLFGIVVGGTATTTAQGTSNLGAGAFRMFTVPGQASLITSPCISMTTSDSSQIPSLGVTDGLIPAGGTRFWLTPNTRDIPTPPNPAKS